MLYLSAVVPWKVGHITAKEMNTLDLIGIDGLTHH